MPRSCPQPKAGAAVDDLGTPMILRERLPITDLDKRVLAVAIVYRDAAPILARLDAIRWQAVAVTLTRRPRSQARCCSSSSGRRSAA